MFACLSAAQFVLFLMLLTESDPPQVVRSNGVPPKVPCLVGASLCILLQKLGTAMCFLVLINRVIRCASMPVGPVIVLLNSFERRLPLGFAILILTQVKFCKL